MEELEISHDSLLQELRTASDDALVVAALMCIYRVTPVLLNFSSPDAEARFPSVERWASGADRAEQLEILEMLRGEIEGKAMEDASEELEDIFSMASEMVLRAFVDDFTVVEWADWCSSLCLDIHQGFDGLGEEEMLEVRFYPAGTYPDLTELQACELEDQVTTLRLLHARTSLTDMKLLEISEKGRGRVGDALSQVLESGM